MSIKSFKDAKRLVLAKAEELAEKVHLGHEKEVLVPLILRDFLATHNGLAPMLHTIGMARFKEHLKLHRLRMVH